MQAKLMLKLSSRFRLGKSAPLPPTLSPTTLPHVIPATTTQPLAAAITTSSSEGVVKEEGGGGGGGGKGEGGRGWEIDGGGDTGAEYMNSLVRLERMSAELEGKYLLLFHTLRCVCVCACLCECVRVSMSICLFLLACVPRADER